VVNKTIFCAVIIVLFIAGCSSDIKEYKLQNIAAKTKEIILEDTSRITSYITDAALYKDSLMFMTLTHELVLLKYDFARKKISKISQNGGGPGEYIKPRALALYNKTLALKDNGSMKTQVYDLDGNYISVYDNKYGTGAYYIAYDEKGILYYFVSDSGEYYLKNSNGEKYYRIPACFEKVKGGIIGGTILSYKNIIYFLNPYEMIIHSFNVDTKTEGAIRPAGMSKYFDWEPLYSQNITPEKFKKIISDEMVLRPYQLYVYTVSEKVYFILKAYNNNSRTFLYYVVTEKGRTLFSFTNNDGNMFGTYKESLIFSSLDNNTKEIKGFVTYEFNEKIKENFNE
jgi:hypothetical protein